MGKRPQSILLAFRASAALLILLACSTIRADVIELGPDYRGSDPTSVLEFFEDKTKTLTIDDITSKEISAKFVPRTWEDRIQTENSISTWIRFTIRHKRTSNPPEWYLAIYNPYIELLELYCPTGPVDKNDNPTFEVITQTGNKKKPADTIMIQLPSEDFDEETFYLRLDQKWRDVTRIYFTTVEGRLHAVSGDSLNNGIFYGMMLVIAVVNLMFFLILRDKSYLWQVLFLLSTMFFFFMDHRLVLKFLPRIGPDTQWRLLACAIAMILFWFCFFSRAFLDTKKNTPRSDKMIKIYIVLSAGLIVLSPFLPISYISRYMSILGLIVPIVALVPGFLCLRQGFYAARFYLAGWIVFSITTPLAATVFMGTQWGGRLLQTGIVINAFLLTIALVDRMRLLSKEKASLEKASRVAEQQMMHADKMVALGQIMAGVAHEINNPNNFIHFNLPIMKRYVEEMEPRLESHLKDEPDLKLANMPYEMFIDDVYKLISNMQHGSTRITKIVGELKDYVHGGDGEDKKPASIQEVVNQSIALVGKQVHKMVKKLDVELDPNLPVVCMNTGKIEQVLINLLINAGHAADKDNSFINLRASRDETNTDFVKIVIEDNGTGIPEDVLRKMFDPFFTTKERGIGTGLGLSISQKIIEDHCGTLDVESTVGAGTTFSISLPAIIS